LFNACQIAFLSIVPGNLSAAQVLALSNSLLTGEPYRLFAPNVMERFYGAAAASSFQAAWAANANTLIGGGMAA
jgi:hypothetical protein